MHVDVSGYVDVYISIWVDASTLSLKARKKTTDEPPAKEHDGDEGHGEESEEEETREEDVEPDLSGGKTGKAKSGRGKKGEKGTGKNEKGKGGKGKNGKDKNAKGKMDGKTQGTATKGKGDGAPTGDVKGKGKGKDELEELLEAETDKLEREEQGGEEEPAAPSHVHVWLKQILTSMLGCQTAFDLLETAEAAAKNHANRCVLRSNSSHPVQI